jgi:beta-galactosidase
MMIELLSVSLSHQWRLWVLWVLCVGGPSQRLPSNQVFEIGQILIDSGLFGDDAQAMRPPFDDRSWSDINLPSSFSLRYFQSPKFYVGYGGYRKHLQINAHGLERQSFLELEIAFQEAEVFVNRQRVGLHRGGYTGFSKNISRALRPGDNVIAIRVNNKCNPQLNPRAGGTYFDGIP